MLLYHSEVSMPEEYVAGARRLMASAGNAVLSVHVLDWVRGGGDASRQHKHRFSLSELTASLQAIARTRPAPFEVGVVGGSVVEYAVRVPLDCSRNLSAVVGADGVVRTAWVNSSRDVHRSLDRRRYVDGASSGCSIEQPFSIVNAKFYNFSNKNC